MATFVETTIFTVIHCAVCGVPFGITSDYENRRREDHASFHCPSGHRQSYSGQSEAEKLRDQLTKQKHLTEQAEANAKWYGKRLDEVNTEKRSVERSLRATKAVVTRTKKKIVAGRCPCCSTKFKDLAVHMRTEHPNYDPEKAVAALEAKG